MLTLLHTCCSSTHQPAVFLHWPSILAVRLLAHLSSSCMSDLTPCPVILCSNPNSPCAPGPLLTTRHTVSHPVTLCLPHQPHPSFFSASGHILLFLLFSYHQTSSNQISIKPNFTALHLGLFMCLTE